MTWWFVSRFFDASPATEVPCLKVPLDLEIAPFFLSTTRKYPTTTTELFT